MPCADVNEILKIDLDAADRLIDYSLTKMTCGGVLGKEALLKKWCGGLSTDEILSTTINSFCDRFPTNDPVVEFVRLKHLLALQKGLRALIGEDSSRPDDAIAVEAIEYSENGVSLVALLKVDAVTDEIRACGKCAGCGTRAK